MIKKLTQLQNELKAPKNQYNSFGKYNYRSAEDILEGVKPLLAKHNLGMTISDEVKVIGDRYYVEATVTLYDFDSDKTIESKALAREEETKKGMDGAQVTGSSSSYARKYALNGMFAIDDTKDSDFTNTHGKEVKQQTKKKTTTQKETNEKMMSEGTNKAIARLSKDNENNKKIIIEELKKLNKQYKDLTQAEASMILSKLEKEEI